MPTVVRSPRGSARQRSVAATKRPRTSRAAAERPPFAPDPPDGATSGLASVESELSSAVSPGPAAAAPGAASAVAPMFDAIADGMRTVLALTTREPGPAHDLPLWREGFAVYDWLLLRTSAVYLGLGLPRGDGSAVVTVPGFLGTDTYLLELHWWLRRMGYSAYASRIGRNADCPNLLLSRLLGTVERAQRETGRRVHLIGHSLGGVLARSAASHRPDLVASVVSLGSPFRGIRSHPIVLRTRDIVRRIVFGRPERQFLPSQCYTGTCTCAFVEALDRFPAEVRELAVYSRSDGVVDWRVCVTGEPGKDREVIGTHVGMAFNPFVYRLLAEFFAAGPGPARA